MLCEMGVARQTLSASIGKEWLPVVRTRKANLRVFVLTQLVKEMAHPLRLQTAVFAPLDL